VGLSSLSEEQTYQAPGVSMLDEQVFLFLRLGTFFLVAIMLES
jgi:hypothetical protein